MDMVEVVLIGLACVVLGFLIGFNKYWWQQQRERDYPKPDWFPGEEEEADEWLARTHPPGHEMCRCAVHWCELEVALANEEALRVKALQPINSASWTGRE